MSQDRRDSQWRSRSARSAGDRHGFRRRGDREYPVDDGRRQHSRSHDDGGRGFSRGRGGSSSDDRGRYGHARGDDAKQDRGRRREERGDRFRRQQDGRGRRFSGHGRRDGGGRDSRPSQRRRVPEPSVPENVRPADLEASARRELRALGRANAENVSRHLVMLQRLLVSDPELAYQHARYAASHAGRVAVVRESAGIAAYLAGHYAEALREIRAARRLSGLDMHRAIEADCERALGRHQQALKIAKEVDPNLLDDLEEAELAMVVSGVRHDRGQDDLGLVVIEEAIMMFRGDRETLRRLHSVRADRLENLGRADEAAAIRERIGEGPRDEPENDVEVYDIEDDYDQEQAVRAESADAPDIPSEEDASRARTDDLTETVGDGGLAGETPEGLSAVPVGGDGTFTSDESTEELHGSASFSERVEEEMAELLGETGHVDESDGPEDQEA